MDSLFQKMLAESNTEIETNVDIVFVIDVTKSMERMIDIIQTAAISFLDEFFEKMNSMKRRVENLRVKVISFRDFYYDGNHAYNESKFFTMPNEKMGLKEYLNGIYADGGGDDPESGLEAFAMAMKSDFVQKGERNVILLSSLRMQQHILLRIMTSLLQKQRERDTSQLYIQKTCQKISMNYIMCGKAIQKTSVKR